MFSNDTVIYVENPKESKNLLELLGNYRSRDSRLVYKSQLLFYIPAMNKWDLKFKPMPFPLAHPKMKYGGTNLKNMYEIYLRKTTKPG